MYRTIKFEIVLDGITEDDAERILEIVTEIGTIAGADVGGGYYVIEDDESEGDNGAES